MRTLKNRRFMAALVGLTAAIGCGKANPNQDNGANPTAVPSISAPAASAPAPVESAKPAAHVELQLASVANTMTFDKTALTVPAGAEVHLVFKNNSNVATLPHNWVLVKPGTEASVAAAGLKLGEKAGYIDVSDHDMLTNTPLAKPGETTELTFTAPDAGKYPFICTVPGHYMMMKGVLTVTP